MRAALKRLAGSGEDRGASAVEYSLIVVAIAAIIVAVVFALGRLTDANFATTCENLESRMTVAGANC